MRGLKKNCAARRLNAFAFQTSAMFTGIIEEEGRITAIKKGGGTTFTLRAKRPFVQSLKLGDSVAINGVCQTVTEIQSDTFSFFATEATLAITTLKRLTHGSVVNLERAMLANGRFDGHIVQGHVDAETTVLRVSQKAEAHRITFALPEEIARYVVKKGAIAIDGISLTVYDVDVTSWSVVIIPYTFSHTTLAHAGEGVHVNVEVDVLAKYVERLLSSRSATPSPPSDREKKLETLLHEL